jgi:hypothetical protein
MEKMGSSKQLSAAYSACRESFQKDLAEKQSDVLRKMLITAIANADVCLKVFIITLPPSLKAWSEKLNSTTKSIIENQQRDVESTKTQVQLAEKISDPEIRKQTLVTVNNIKELLLRSFEDQAAVVAHMHDLQRALVIHFASTLEDLFQNGKGSRAVEIVLSLLEFLVGQIPVAGRSVSALETIIKILRGGEGVEAADQYMRGLEGFNQAAFYWAVTAYFVFHNMALPDDVQTISLDQARGYIRQLVENERGGISAGSTLK